MKVLLLSACLFLNDPTSGELPSFTRKPTAARAGDKVRIEFAVSRPTDAAVFIEDAQGRVVRHLAAGVLGKNPPKPFKPDSLAQSVEWDGKADWGKPAGPGPFKVRVALGLGATYDKVVGSAPENFGRPTGLGIGRDGTLYVAAHESNVVNWESRHVVALNRDGSYQRTLIPLPADASRERIAFMGSPSIQVGGKPVPTVTNMQQHRTSSFWPASGGDPAVAPDGTLLVPQDGAVCAVPATNALPPGAYAGAKIAVAGKPASFGRGATLVVSGDGKWVYVSGLAAGDKNGAPVPAVYRVKLPDRSGAEPFFGDPASPGNDATHLATPCGMALDGKGNLLVADRANGRVAVISESGGLVGSFKVENPEGVAVDPRSGAVYVLQVSSKVAGTLLKFNSWKEGKLLSQVALGAGRSDRYGWSLALDVSAGPAVVWVANVHRGLLRLEDGGEKLGAPVAVGAKEGDLFGNVNFLDLVADPYRADPVVYARTRGSDGGYAFVRFNEVTEKFERLVLEERYIHGAAGTCVVPGPDGNLYALNQQFPGMFRFDPNGKALTWEEPRPAERDLARPGQEERYRQRYSQQKLERHSAFVRVCMVYMTHTMGIRPDGHIFVFERSPKFDHRQPKALYEYAPSGKRLGGPVLWMAGDSVVGPKFDQEGNIYVAEHVKPVDQIVPPEYAALTGPVKMGGTVPGGKGGAALIYGSILKFSPRGGMIDHQASKWGKPFDGEAKLDPDLKTVDAAWLQNGMLQPAKVTGAEWMRLGVSHVEPPCSNCNCENIRFEVDPFGRVWYPDLGRYRVGVLDTSGNEIVTIGGYGNADSRGPESKDSKLADPGIAFSWPHAVGVTGKYVYVGDAGNRRMLRAKVTYAVQETCPAP